MKPKEIHNGIYLVGSSDMTDAKDCCVYLLNLGDLVLIDAGAGTSAGAIIRNIESLGFDAARVSTLVLTHCHIDHVGGAAAIRERTGARIVMHELDAVPVEAGDQRMTAAHWYGVRFQPLPVDLKFSGHSETLSLADCDLVLLHTPGHTPGSLSVYLDRDGKRVLFGQDIHGPFLADFGANMSHWQSSMEELLALNADILCEGHFGIYQPNKKVTAYIERYLEEYGE
jgi:glyoxylase-like metal-dependent hydrolase (beta-lactamase superfamily II)